MGPIVLISTPPVAAVADIAETAIAVAEPTMKSRKAKLIETIMGAVRVPAGLSSGNPSEMPVTIIVFYHENIYALSKTTG